MNNQSKHLSQQQIDEQNYYESLLYMDLAELQAQLDLTLHARRARHKHKRSFEADRHLYRICEQMLRFLFSQNDVLIAISLGMTLGEYLESDSVESWLNKSYEP